MATQRITPETTSAHRYTVHARCLGRDGKLTERVFTADEIDRLTPSAPPVLTSREELLAGIMQATEKMAHL